MSSKNIKVIIVGGGPVGLTAAHALSRAGIDFVLLESRPSVVIDAGSNLVLNPIGLRILGEMGLLETLNNVSSPLGKVQRFDHDGHDLGDINFFVRWKENHGLAPRVISRHDLTSVLYTTLPTAAQSSLHANKKVSSVNTTPDSITAYCTDGTSYTGTLLIGADGAHSRIRSFMNAAEPTATDNDANPFLTTYRALWIRFPTAADLLPAGVATETHGPDCAIQTFSGAETSVIGLYERLPAPTRDRLRFTAADEAAIVGRWGYLPISRELTVADAYATRVQAGLVSLEEGVVADWSGDRTVLVGDAAHKFTPSTGAGCNNGIVDVVVLVNELRRAMDGGAEMDVQDIRAACRAYQAERYESVVRGCEFSGRVTGTATWGTGMARLVDKHVMSIQRLQRFMMDRTAAAIARTPVLEFAEREKMAGGRLPWAEQGMSRAVKA
ncbi:hypothetical protein B0T18DRAFT_439030 [Schizothecium vesticola]|uniref:FAD-binding domain-containing protein n=1 Tax=Schizothecium vesticola TaxID=314040 RepID=A0AA40EP51_9PEZI|nr:hypothetical protein B0T18DRAFT_439030 [Schizothecium vesticola]